MIRTGDGQSLAERIAHIEARATEAIQRGLAADGVLTGANSLLRIAAETAEATLVNPSDPDAESSSGKFRRPKPVD